MCDLAKFYVLGIMVISLSGIGGERTSRKIYEDLDASFACIRRLNATHQIGCSSYRKGDVGVIHYVNSTESFDWLVDKGPHAPYIVVLDQLFVSMHNLAKLEDSGKINGVVVIKSGNGEIPRGFSPDNKCPNKYSGLYRNDTGLDGCEIEWNSYGEGIFYEDWPFAIFLLTNDSDISTLIDDCYGKFNAPIDGVARDWPLCSVELMSNMFAAKDAITCMRRSNMITNLNPVRFCDPIGDYNIWSTLFPMNKSTEVANRSIIVIAARMDSYSMFHDYAPAADSTAIGIVTLLATAHVLTDILKDYDGNVTGNVLFALFNGESFEYIGSSRMVYDMEKDNFPDPLDGELPSQYPLIKLEHLKYFLELNQVGLPQDDKIFWLHTDPISTADQSVNSVVESVVQELESEGPAYNLEFKKTQPGQPLPPASLQSFLLKDGSLPGVVITDHEKKFNNKFYNSIYDDKSVFNVTNFNESGQSVVDFVSSLTATVVATVSHSLTNQRLPNVHPDADLVRKLLECYLIKFECELFRQIARQPEKARPLQYYVGVDGNENVMRARTTLIMSNLTGTVLVNVTQDECRNPSNNTIYSYYWLKGETGDGFCVKSLVNTSKAVSPSFLNSDSISTDYPVWTESVWDKISMRIFVKPSKRQEVVTLVIGILVAALAFLSVWFLGENSTLLFGPKVSTC